MDNLSCMVPGKRQVGSTYSMDLAGKRLIFFYYITLRFAQGGEFFPGYEQEAY